MTFQTILLESVDDTAILTLNRPQVSNGFNIPMCQEILEAIDYVTQNDQLHFLIFKATGKVFSVGGDLDQMEKAVSNDDVQSLVDIAKLVQEISIAIKQLPKPVIMCADGAVAGAAANIALAVDFCLASTQTKFIQAFVNLALAPDAGGLYLLTRAVGLNRATHLVMTGESVSAEKAQDYGFVYRAVETDKMDKTLNQLLKRLRRGSTNSYAAMKALVWESYFKGWDDYGKLELELQEELAFKEDFKEGVRAFSERRLPRFQGK
ncbi:enoyl-CoA hydratase [Streptococcus penaeicida]|uniref:Enoyl-CoA hydratase n=1 Tax=Streptococcus penaeicida TaxID=1765960 RepID=A0A2N8LE24_9STRE|nr:enoyl-CoA hydratase [Streptococcus penaeicida]PND48412.1 enoyl-CoA hydratase [Streptococcus penaeicida]